jgi:hypothetical protein
MGQMTQTANRRSPASQALLDAIDRAVEGESMYPERATFVDAEAPDVGRQIAAAHADGRAVVLCYGDGNRLVVQATAPAAA